VTLIRILGLMCDSDVFLALMYSFDKVFNNDLRVFRIDVDFDKVFGFDVEF
jgi:hypothetical protein